jgi:excisionase family DNA binding protein
MKNVVFSTRNIDELISDIAAEVAKIIESKHSRKACFEDNYDMFMTVDQAADFLHLKVPTIYSKVSRGELSPSKRGGRLYFSRSDLTEYIMQGSRTTVEEIQNDVPTILKSRKK